MRVRALCVVCVTHLCGGRFRRSVWRAWCGVVWYAESAVTKWQWPGCLAHRTMQNGRVLCCVVLCCVVLCCVVLCCVVLCCVVLCCVVLCCVVLCWVGLRCVGLRCVVLCCVVLCCVVLCCAVLCCVVLGWVVLCCSLSGLCVFARAVCSVLRTWGDEALTPPDWRQSQFKGARGTSCRSACWCS